MIAATAVPRDKLRMYLPASFSLDDEVTIEAFIGQYDFATIVTASSSGRPGR